MRTRKPTQPPPHDMNPNEAAPRSPRISGIPRASVPPEPQVPSSNYSLSFTKLGRYQQRVSSSICSRQRRWKACGLGISDLDEGSGRQATGCTGSGRRRCRRPYVSGVGFERGGRGGISLSGLVAGGPSHMLMHRAKVLDAQPNPGGRGATDARPHGHTAAESMFLAQGAVC